MQRNAIAARGTVAAPMPNRWFQVHLDNGHDVRAEAPGELRFVPGDRVTVELRPPDLIRGRITTWAK